MSSNSATAINSEIAAFPTLAEYWAASAVIRNPRKASLRSFSDAAEFSSRIHKCIELALRSRLAEVEKEAEAAEADAHLAIAESQHLAEHVHSLREERDKLKANVRGARREASVLRHQEHVKSVVVVEEKQKRAPRSKTDPKRDARAAKAKNPKATKPAVLRQRN